MANTPNTPTSLASRLKQRYAKGISSLVPVDNYLKRNITFRKDLAPGEAARFDVQLSLEQGFSVGTGDFTLNDSIAQSTAKATVEGKSIVLKSRVSYDLIARAKTNEQAFVNFHDSKFIPMVDSFSKREELLSLVGGDSLGQVLTCAAGVITFTVQSWSAGRWNGAKGAVLEAFSAKTGGTQYNGDLVVTAVNSSARQITVSGTSTAVVANAVLFYKGHRGNEPTGIMTIAKNAGVLYGIDAATNELWRANAFDASTSALTLGKILNAAALSADKGASEELDCLVPIATFQSIVSDQAALRHYAADYDEKQGKNGFEKLSFYGSTGRINIIPHRMMAAGEAVIVPMKQLSYIGASEMTNELGDNGEMYFDVESSASKEMRTFAEWTVFCERPGFVTLITRSDGLALHT